MIETILQRINDVPAWVLILWLIAYGYHMRRYEKALDAQNAQLNNLQDRLDELIGGVGEG